MHTLSHKLVDFVIGWENSGEIFQIYSLIFAEILAGTFFNIFVTY